MNIALAGFAGVAGAVLQAAGALKTAPPLAFLPFDLTILALVLLLPALALLLATRRWLLAPGLGLPIAGAACLWFWLVVAGGWSASGLVLGQKLPEIVVLGPLMLVAGLVLGAEPAARGALAAASLWIGVGIGVLVGLGAQDMFAGPDGLEQARVHYQLAGLAMASAAALAAVRAVESRGAARLGWLALVGGLAAASLLPGGRTALLALGAGVALAPALLLHLAGRGRAAMLWLALVALAGLAGAALLLLDPERAEGLRTLERLTGDPAGLEARLALWSAALEWAGREAPFGLGTGGFSIAAGHGEWRGRYPHNHALEALAEGGLPGLLLWLTAFGGAALVAWRHAAGLGPAAAARIAALTLPVAFTLMVSTDLGNRMAWFALGLALSCGVAARPAAWGRLRHV